MTATSPDAPPPGPSGWGEGGDGPPDATAPGGARPPPLPPPPPPPPLGLDTAPLLEAVGLLGGDEGEDEEDLDTGDVVLREGEDERGKAGPHAGKPSQVGASLSLSSPFSSNAGSEDASYIYVDLAGVDPALLPTGGELTVEVSKKVEGEREGRAVPFFPPQARVVTATLTPTLHSLSPFFLFLSQGLDTAAPSLRLPGGRRLTGTWRETVGSLLFVNAASGPASGAGGEEGRAGGGGGEEAHRRHTDALPADTGPLHSPARPGSYLCHTEKVLAFRSDGRKRRAGG